LESILKEEIVKFIAKPLNTILESNTNQITSRVQPLIIKVYCALN